MISWNLIIKPFIIVTYSPLFFLFVGVEFFFSRPPILFLGPSLENWYFLFHFVFCFFKAWVRDHGVVSSS